MNDHTTPDPYGFDELSDEEGRALADDVSKTLFQSATLRFLSEIEEKEGRRFESMLADRDAGIERVINEFPRFAAILKEEAAALDAEARSTLP